MMLNPNVPKIEKAVIAAILREPQLLEYAQAAEDARKPRLEWLNDAIQRLHDAFIEERATGIFLAQFNRSGSNSDAPPPARQEAKNLFFSAINLLFRILRDTL